MNDRYTYRVEWSDDDDAYVARCLEFPSLGAHGASTQEALSQIETVVAESLQWMLEDGETAPESSGSAMAWDREIEARFAAFDRGQTEIHSAEDVFAEARRFTDGNPRA